MTPTTLFQVIQVYLEMGFLIILGSVLFKGLIAILSRSRFKGYSAQLLQAGYFLLISAICLPWILIALPRSQLMRPSAQVFSNKMTQRLNTSDFLTISLPVEGQAVAQSPSLVLPERVLFGIVLAVAMIVCFRVLIFLRRLLSFHLSLRSLPVIKKIGRVRILASDYFPIAFSAWTPLAALIVIPTDVLGEYSDFKLTVAHEIQHHRNGDTRWLYFLEWLKALFFWNPGSYGFSKLLTDLQEFACDEFLIGRRKVSLRAYGGCLIRAAETVIGPKARLVGTASMATQADPSLLKRRIEMMVKSNHEKKWPSTYRKLTLCLTLGTLIVMTSFAYAAKSTVQIRKITLDEAQKYAVVASVKTEVPITVNDLVLEKLNEYVGTREGRQWVKESKKRMPLYNEMILKNLDHYSLPRELIAMPFFESGFKNEVIGKAGISAGIWAFISETARRYDLEVSEKVDERLVPEKETVAAMRYLTDLKEQFKEQSKDKKHPSEGSDYWLLAIKAYNEGESHVQSLIHEYGTKDPWILEHKSSAEGYLPGVIAMMIILSNPELSI